MADNSYTYQVSARKYRPATFRSVVGQRTLTETLKNAVSSGRVAQAYLFCGPRGVGKTTCARIFAKTVNCLNPTPDGEACGVCEACRAIDEGNSLNLLELDAASNNSVNDIRDLMDQVNIPPQNGRYRVFIIDEVHMLSSAAFNAFLKTLEEPPKYVVFILATTEKHKVIPTILSRCQIYDFKRITIDDMVEHLKYVASSEGITYEEAALDLIARKADGALRDALSIFDQVSASCRGNITYAGAVASLNVLDYEYYFRLVDCFVAGDIPGSLLLYGEVREHGFDSLFFVSGLASHLRNLMVAADPRTVALLETSKSVAERYVAQAASLPPVWYYQALAILNECDVNYRTAANKQLVVEYALVRLASMRNADVQQAMREQSGRPVAAPQPRPAAPASPAPTAAQPAPVHHDAPAPSASPAPRVAPARPAPRAAVKGPRQSIHINAKIASETTGDGKDDEHHRAKSPNPDAPEISAAPDGYAAEAKSITEESLTEAWQAYIAAHPEQKIVVNTMRTRLPEPTGKPAEYLLKVDNPAQEAQLRQHSPQLHEFIRNQLGNSSFVLRFALSDGDTGTRLLTPRELLAEGAAKNPNIANLLGFLDAELI